MASPSAFAAAAAQAFPPPSESTSEVGDHAGDLPPSRGWSAPLQRGSGGLESGRRRSLSSRTASMARAQSGNPFMGRKVRERGPLRPRGMGASRQRQQCCALCRT